MKKIIIPGFLAGIGMLLAGFFLSPITNFIFPGTSAEYQNPNLFRPWSDPIMSLYFLYPFLVGMLLAWIWNRFKGEISPIGKMNKGVFFGMGYWFITLPGMLMSYASFPLSLAIVLSWTLSGLVELIAAGIILEKTNR